MMQAQICEIEAEQLRELRWKNFVLNARERGEGKVTLESMPPTVMLPTGRRCNLRCKMCIDRSNPVEFRDFTLDEFLHLAPELESASSIAIYGWGEPFMNPDYDRILDHVTKRYPGVIVHISTNGTLLTRRRRKKLVGQSNLFLNISINAATRETYRNLMGVDLFNRVLSNVSSLMREKRESGSGFPVVTLSFVILRQNHHEIPMFYTLAKELGADDVLVSDLMLLEEDHFDLKVDELYDEVRESYLTAKHMEVPALGPTLTPFTDMPYLPTMGENICHDPWESFKIGDDGSVSICCYANRTFGNVFEQSVADIWNSEDVMHYRATVNTANPPQPCRSCPKKRGLFE